MTSTDKKTYRFTRTNPCPWVIQHHADASLYWSEYWEDWTPLDWATGYVRKQHKDLNLPHGGVWALDTATTGGWWVARA